MTEHDDEFLQEMCDSEALPKITKSAVHEESEFLQKIRKTESLPKSIISAIQHESDFGPMANDDERLIRGVLNEEPWAIMEYLSTHAADRGYGPAERTGEPADREPKQ